MKSMDSKTLLCTVVYLLNLFFCTLLTAQTTNYASLFTSPTLPTPDLHINNASPAYNTGNPAFSPAAGETDMDGETRSQAGQVDIGADEVAMMSPPSPQVQWLAAQQDLNTTGLTDSYEGDGQHNAYTYDQALTIIAFTMEGETTRATDLLTAMQNLQEADGAWFSCYNANTTIACSSQKPTGAISWMVMAINYYEHCTGDVSYAAMAIDALSWLDTKRFLDKNIDNYGALGLCGGAGCAFPDAVSTENNYDAYSAYLYRGILAGDCEMVQKANLIKNYLAKEMWGNSPVSDGPFNLGVFWVGYQDYGWFTDPQSWGVLALGGTGDIGQDYSLALEWLHSYGYGFGSTRHAQSFNGTTIDGFDYHTKATLDATWLEGTEGVAAAYYAIGDNVNGDYFHNETAKVISANGGIPYSFSEIDPSNIRFPENFRNNSVAATTWFYFNELQINPFTLPLNNTCSVTYTAENVNFSNPERGTYRQYNAYSGSLGTALEPLNINDLLTDQANNISLCLRLYYLEDFLTSNVSSDYLNLIQNDMNTIRQSGQKAILRFAYNESEQTYEHNLDASLTWVLQHIADVTPVLQANSDVIALVQAGFIGTWGEWHYTHSDFVTTGSTPDNAARQQVLDALLAAFPDNRMIQVRVPQYKGDMYDSGNLVNGTNALPLADAYNGSTLARVAHHNDCFLASDTDFGTYSNNVAVRADEKDYLEAETRFLVMGGETCALNIPRSDCASEGGDADTELDRFHWSYLNEAYNLDVLNRWDSGTGGPGDCYDEIRNRLGYRFELIEGDFSSEVAQTCGLDIYINLVNRGYAAPYNPRRVELILRETTTGEIFVADLPNQDPRFWFKETEIGYITICETIGIPNDVPAGTYDLLLHLPDPESNLYANPLYSIRLANAGVWEAATGFNNLNHQVTITANPCSSVHTGNQWAITFGCNAGDGVVLADNQLDFEEVVSLETESFSILNPYTIGWALDDAPVTNEAELANATILNERGSAIDFTHSDCNETGIQYLTPFSVINNATYNYQFPDEMVAFWGSSMTIDLDLSAAGIPYDANYPTITTITIVDASSGDFFANNGANFSFTATPANGISQTQNPVNAPMANQIATTFTFANNNPNTVWSIDVTDNTAGVGGWMIAQISVSVPFPTIDPTCTDFGTPVQIELLPCELRVKANVFLEGAFNNGTSMMNNTLQMNNLLPLNQPFNRVPWNYTGAESVANAAAIPANTVDWVLLEVRDEADNAVIIEQKAGFLLADGSVRHTDGTEGIPFDLLTANQNYYLSVKTRHHLAILGENSTILPNVLSYDFTDVINVAGSQQVVDLGNGIYGMKAGDHNSDGIISVTDFNGYIGESSGLNQYLDGDFNEDGNVTVTDFNLYLPNASVIGVSQIRY